MTTNLPAFRQQMDKMAVEFGRVLPPHLTSDRLYRTTLNAVQQAQKANGKNALLEADRTSLLSAVMTSAVLGLEPDGVTGQGYLVPFKGKVQFIPGYKGLITLAFNSGFALEGHLVHENDMFSQQKGTDPKINHAPPSLGQDRGGIIGAYATARSNNVPAVSVVMDINDILKVRDRSAGYQSSKKFNYKSTWDTEFEGMARKTPIRRLGGNLPLNVQRAIALEQSFDEGKTASIDPEGTVVQDDGSEVMPPEGEAA